MTATETQILGMVLGVVTGLVIVIYALVTAIWIKVKKL